MKIKNFEAFAKECTTCPDFCEEDCVENAECARGNDVFDGCKTVKAVMEVQQELNARFGKLSDNSKITT